jgi:hypothetical protein
MRTVGDAEDGWVKKERKEGKYVTTLVLFSLAFARTLPLKRCRSNAAAQTLPLKRCRSNAAAQTLPLKRCRSNAAAQTLPLKRCRSNAAAQTLPLKRCRSNAAAQTLPLKRCRRRNYQSQVTTQLEWSHVNCKSHRKKNGAEALSRTRVRVMSRLSRTVACTGKW